MTFPATVGHVINWARRDSWNSKTINSIRQHQRILEDVPRMLTCIMKQPGMLIGGSGGEGGFSNKNDKGCWDDSRKFWKIEKWGTRISFCGCAYSFSPLRDTNLYLFIYLISNQ